LEDVLIITPEIFTDFRGSYTETFNRLAYEQAIKEATGKDVSFVTDSIVRGNKHTLRGLHGDDRTWKLLTCVSGEMYFVVANCDERSANFGKWINVTLTGENRKQVLVPPFHGNGHITMNDAGSILTYKQSEYYRGSDKQFTYRFNSPRFNIDWPIRTPIISERDLAGRD
jgi:dTDP-4-dehydrorhamnose 3,5-epimerase